MVNKRFFSVLLAGSILIATASAANANNNSVNFREFRQQNQGMDRHAARQLYRDTYRGHSVTGATPPTTTNPGGNATAGGGAGHWHHIIWEGPNQVPTLSSHGQTRQTGTDGNLVRLRSGIDLDLTSTTKNVVLGRNLFNGKDSVTIDVGGGSKTFSAGSQVSAAEYIAVKQVLAGGGQKVTLDQGGRAVGGNVDLDAITSVNDTMRAASLVVGNNVTTSGDFSRGSDFRLLGDLNNHGTVNAFGANGGAIRAHDINNYKDGSITSSVDLTLDASGHILNAGTIASTAGLTLTAGSGINNTGSVSTSNDLTLNAAVIGNHGLLSSANGNVNLNGSAAPATNASTYTPNLTVNNINGTISALNGAINLRDASYNGSGNSSIVGGDLLSKEFVSNAGQGTANINVNQLTGVVSQTGNAAHISANTDNLNIGYVCLTGDPTIFNTGGSITISSQTFNSGEDLVVVASGNIVVTNTATLQVGGSGTNGNNITFIAGADFTNSTGTNSSTIGPVDGSPGDVSISGKSSKTGGGIFIDSGAQIRAQATGSLGNSNGGNVSLIAFDGKGVAGGPIGGGVIDNRGTILTGGSGSGTNGNVTGIAGASKPADFAISTGNINTTGGSGTGGDITFTTAAPVSSEKKTPVQYNAAGQLVGTATLVASTKLNKAGSIVTTGVINTGGAINLTAGDEIYVQSNVTATGIIRFSAGNEILDGGSPNPVTSSSAIYLNSGGTIGAPGDAFDITTPILGVVALGPGANIEVAGPGSGTLTLAEDPTTPGNGAIFAPNGIVTITADNRTVSAAAGAAGAIVTRGLIFDVDSFGTFQNITSTLGVTFESHASGAGFTNANLLGTLTTPALEIFVDGNIGTSGTDFIIPVAVEGIHFQSANGGVFATSNSTKAMEVFDTFAGGGDLKLLLQSDVNIVDGGNGTFGDNVQIRTQGGTIDVNGRIFSTTGNVTLNNQSTKGKIALETDASVQTGAIGTSINLLLGNGSTTDTPLPIKNVVIDGAALGTATLKGGGIKAKAPDNFINPEGVGSIIFINNGNKSGNLTFGGNVDLTTAVP